MTEELTPEQEQRIRYMIAQGALPGAIGKQQRWTRAWMLSAAVGWCSVVVGGLMMFSTLAGVRAERNHGFVVAIDRETGEKLDLPVASAADFRLTDGMVRHRLVKTVTCLRGLDSDPGIVRRCWRESVPLFEGDEATSALKKHEEARGLTHPGSLERAQATELVSIEMIDVTKPEKTMPGRWWMRWREIHKPRSGQAGKVEVWSGTFDTELLPIEDRPDSQGMRIVRWEWHQDVS